MSHSHSHAPGELHSHSHSHSPPVTPQTPQTPFIPPPDPAIQALIDQSFTPVPLTLSSDCNSALCAAHSLEKCSACDVDFISLNRISRILAAHPNLLCPPPPNVVNPKLSQVVTSTKEEGNTLFKSSHPTAALARYTTALQLAVSRPPWETHQLMRDELSTVLSNRSAAHLENGDLLSALADAEAVIQIKRNWSKGYFRQAKALMAMGETREAADAVRLGLSFDPKNAELTAFLTEIETYARDKRAAKDKARAKLRANPAPTVSLVA